MIDEIGFFQFSTSVWKDYHPFSPILTVSGSSRAKAIQERLDGTKESASFEIGALFTRLYGEEKSAAISKLADFLVSSSRSYIVLALEQFGFTG